MRENALDLYDTGETFFRENALIYKLNTKKNSNVGSEMSYFCLNVPVNNQTDKTLSSHKAQG